MLFTFHPRGAMSRVTCAARGCRDSESMPVRLVGSQGTSPAGRAAARLFAGPTHQLHSRLAAEPRDRRLERLLHLFVCTTILRTSIPYRSRAAGSLGSSTWHRRRAAAPTMLQSRAGAAPSAGHGQVDWLARYLAAPGTIRTDVLYQTIHGVVVAVKRWPSARRDQRLKPRREGLRLPASACAGWDR